MLAQKRLWERCCWLNGGQVTKSFTPPWLEPKWSIGGCMAANVFSIKGKGLQPQRHHWKMLQCMSWIVDCVSYQVCRKKKKGKSSKRNGEKKNQSCWVAEKTEKELEKLQVFWLEWNSKCFQSRSFTTGSNTRLNVLTNRRKWNWNESIEVLDVSFYQRRCWTSQNSSKMRDQTAIIKTEWKSWRLQKPKRNSTWKAES